MITDIPLKSGSAIKAEPAIRIPLGSLRATGYFEVTLRKDLTAFSDRQTSSASAISDSATDLLGARGNGEAEKLLDPAEHSGVQMTWMFQEP